jgi:hypothetical protein
MKSLEFLLSEEALTSIAILGEICDGGDTGDVSGDLRLFEGLPNDIETSVNCGWFAPVLVPSSDDLLNEAWSDVLNPMGTKSLLHRPRVILDNGIGLEPAIFENEECLLHHMIERNHSF